MSVEELRGTFAYDMAREAEMTGLDSAIFAKVGRSQTPVLVVAVAGELKVEWLLQQLEEKQKNDADAGVQPAGRGKRSKSAPKRRKVQKGAGRGTGKNAGDGKA